MDIFAGKWGIGKTIAAKQRPAEYVTKKGMNRVYLSVIMESGQLGLKTTRLLLGTLITPPPHPPRSNWPLGKVNTPLPILKIFKIDNENI